MPDTDEALRARANAAHIARLATVRPDGSPHLVPITFALTGDTLVTAVDHKPKSTRDLQRLRNIRRSPQVSVLIDHTDHDWSQLWWIRLDGTARILDGPGASGAIDRLVAKYEPYQARRPEGPVIEVLVVTWTSWSA